MTIAVLKKSDCPPRQTPLTVLAQGGDDDYGDGGAQTLDMKNTLHHAHIHENRTTCIIKTTVHTEPWPPSGKRATAATRHTFSLMPAGRGLLTALLPSLPRVLLRLWQLRLSGSPTFWP